MVKEVEAGNNAFVLGGKARLVQREEPLPQPVAILRHLFDLGLKGLSLKYAEGSNGESGKNIPLRHLRQRQGGSASRGS